MQVKLPKKPNLHQEDICVCFLDYRKAFDKVRQQPVITMLEELDIDGKYI